MQTTSHLRDPVGSVWTVNGHALSDRLIDCCSVDKMLERVLDGPHATRPALTWAEPGASPLALSYRQLVAHVHGCAEHLRDRHGLAAGDRMMVISSNCPETFVAHLAIMSIGAITVPVSNLEAPRIARHVASTVQPKAILFGRDVDPQLRKALDGYDSSDLPDPSGLPTKAPPPPGSAQTVRPDDPAVILFTSGTTSEPKGVCLSHYNLAVNAEALCRIHELDKNRTHLCVLPLFHANAFGLSMIGGLYAQIHVVLCAGLPGLATWSIVKEHEVNFISLVPEYLRLLAQRPPDRALLKSLSHVVSAAAPLPVAVAKSFHEATGVRIRQGYGLSECTNFAATLPPGLTDQAYEDLMHAGPVPSIGPSVFGTELDVWRSDQTPAGEGETGELVVRGHSVMRGYWANAQATQEAIGSGYLKTGDLGYFALHNDVRHFFVSGRKKELIIRYGENFSPLAIERELEGLRSIAPFAVAGFPNDLAGEEIGLWVCLPDTPENRRTVEAALGACPAAYRPRLAYLSDLPIPATPTGKVKRADLAKRFFGSRTRAFGNQSVVEGYLDHESSVLEQI